MDTLLDYYTYFLLIAPPSVSAHSLSTRPHSGFFTCSVWFLADNILSSILRDPDTEQATQLLVVSSLYAREEAEHAQWHPLLLRQTSLC